jgi:hypothetical protein
VETVDKGAPAKSLAACGAVEYSIVETPASAAATAKCNSPVVLLSDAYLVDVSPSLQ